uniref:Taste receptor type 2 n=1 Tax=Leptobrachium leishanense TaxID=445787 RepID=A0A8C5QFA6_9ANUR
MLPLESIVLMLVTGVTLNAVILAVNFNEWNKSRTLQLCDQIHIIMGLTNILLQCALGLQSTLYFAYTPLLYTGYGFTTCAVLVTFLVYFNIWLNAWLCAHYFTKIATFTYPFFEWLRGNISVIMPKLILVSAVGSFSISVPYIWNSRVEIHAEYYGNASVNLSDIRRTLHVNSTYQLIAAFLGCFFPFMISNLCLGHTLASLWRHVRRIKHTDSGLSPPNLQAHVRAARTMTLLLLLYLSYYVAQVVCLVYKYSDKTFSAIICLLSLSCPAVHSGILIQASCKMRKYFSHTLMVWEDNALTPGLLHGPQTA